MPFVLLYVLVEIVALVAVASWIGIGATLLVLVAGSVLGMWIARREGVRAVRAVTTAMQERRAAHPEMTDGMLVAVGGLLLFLPGLVTDVAGLLLLFPPTRSLVRRRLVRVAERRAPGLRTARIRSGGRIVDGEVVDSRDGEVVDSEVVNGRDSGDVNSEVVNGRDSGDVNSEVVNGRDSGDVNGHVVTDPAADPRPNRSPPPTGRPRGDRGMLER